MGGGRGKKIGESLGYKTPCREMASSIQPIWAYIPAQRTPGSPGGSGRRRSRLNCSTPPSPQELAGAMPALLLRKDYSFVSAVKQSASSAQGLRLEGKQRMV